MPRLNASPYKYVARECEWCGATFAATVTRVKLGKALYCGDKCANQAKYHQKKVREAAKKTPRVCAVCGREFSRAGTSSTCSQDCKVESARRRTAEMHARIEAAPPPVPLSVVLQGIDEYSKLWDGHGLDARYTPVL